MTGDEFRLLFLGDGVTLAINSLIEIRNVVRKYYPEVAMTKQESKEFEKKSGK